MYKYVASLLKMSAIRNYILFLVIVGLNSIHCHGSKADLLTDIYDEAGLTNPSASLDYEDLLGSIIGGGDQPNAGANEPNAETPFEGFDYTDVLSMLLNGGVRNDTETIDNTKLECHCVEKPRCRMGDSTTASPDPGPSFLDLIKPKSRPCPSGSQVCCEMTHIVCECAKFSLCADNFQNNIWSCAEGEICCADILEVTPEPVGPVDPVVIIPEPAVIEEKSGIMCGTTQTILRRVLHGENAKSREFPWFVAIINQNQKYEFAGSLIHPQIVLTVAHHAKNYDVGDIFINIGSGDLKSKTNQIKGVQEIVMHPQFNAQLLYHDLALLILDSPVEMFLGVSTLCLPTNKKEVYHKAQCLSGGWGKDASDPNSVVGTRLKYVRIPLVGHDTCLSGLRSTRLGPHFNLDRSFICAGGGQIDTCEGDGGSPLVCLLAGDPEGPDRFIQVGVTSWGVDCGVEGVAGIYASVLDDHTWITQIATERFGPNAQDYFVV